MEGAATMPVVYDELGMPEPGPDPEDRDRDQDADGEAAPPSGWTATRWDDGGGVARDDRGDTVIFGSDGTVATATPTGSLLSRPDGSAAEDRFDAAADPGAGDGFE